MNKIDLCCSACKKPLIEIDFNRDHFLHLCDGPDCPMRRQPQGSRARNPDPVYDGLYAGHQAKVR